MSACSNGLGIVSFPCCWVFHPQSPTLKSITHNRTELRNSMSACALGCPCEMRSSRCSGSLCKKLWGTRFLSHISAMECDRVMCREASPFLTGALSNPILHGRREGLLAKRGENDGSTHPSRSEARPPLYNKGKKEAP